MNLAQTISNLVALALVVYTVRPQLDDHALNEWAAVKGFRDDSRAQKACLQAPQSFSTYKCPGQGAKLDADQKGNRNIKTPTPKTIPLLIAPPGSRRTTLTNSKLP
jgi:hypothetical protein